MLDLVKNISDGTQIVVTFFSNFLRHYFYLPELWNSVRYYCNEISALFPAEIRFILVLTVGISALCKVLKWG